MALNCVKEYQSKHIYSKFIDISSGKKIKKTLHRIIYKMENSSITERSHLLIIKDYVDHVTYYMLYIEMILCLCLNTVSILFIVSSRLFTPINLLILNLAVFDMLYSCCIPLFVTQFTGGQIQLSLYGCRISYFLDVTCMIVSTYF
jgi:hypothetical protein